MVDKIKNGDYSAIYFIKTSEIIKSERPNDTVLMQFFQRHDNVKLAGIDECVDLLKHESFSPELLTIFSLNEGDIIDANEPVLKVSGPYWCFGHLEGIIDGILARQTSIATNVFRVMKAAGDKPVIYMNDRNDHYLNQARDGFAAHVGGMENFVTYEQFKMWNPKGRPMGTVPHALIQGFDGDLIAALNAYKKHFPNEHLVALTDYNNDVVSDSLKAAAAFSDLYAVRIDTSEALIDHYFDDKLDKFADKKLIHGVNRHLVLGLRQALDARGFQNVKIIVSSGFNYERICEFEKHNVPVDFYGVGASLAKLTIGFTGDCVQLNGNDQAKFGRKNIVSSRLTKR